MRKCIIVKVGASQETTKDENGGGWTSMTVWSFRPHIPSTDQQTGHLITRKRTNNAFHERKYQLNAAPQDNQTDLFLVIYCMSVVALTTTDVSHRHTSAKSSAR